jgi:hypothetical protein
MSNAPRFLIAGFLFAGCIVAATAASGADAPAAPSGQTTLYKWVDADGVTHYSDHPVTGAEEVHVSGAQTYQSRGNSAPAKPKAPKQVPFTYRRIEVIRPQAGETIFNPGGQIEAAAGVDPGLYPGHQMWFVLDGNRLSDPAPDFTASLPVHRGTHTVAVVVTDEQGREVISSAPLQFFIRETSIATPPQGPLVPPRPR